MREAVKRSDRIDQKRELVRIYKEVRRRKMSAKNFVEKLKNSGIFLERVVKMSECEFR